MRRSSPRLIAKRSKDNLYSRTHTVSSSARRTDIANDSISQKNQSTRKSTNLPMNSQKRGKSIGVDGHLFSTRKGRNSASLSLQMELEKEQSGSDTDSFVSTLGSFNENERQRVDDDNSLKDMGDRRKRTVEEQDVSEDETGENVTDGHDDFHADSNNVEGSDVDEQLSPILLSQRGRVESDGTLATSDIGRGAPKKTQRAMNYTETEDLLLTKAYVSVSNDPINGSQQRANIFWAKVHQKYKVLLSQQGSKTGVVSRPVESLKQRYLKVIAKAVGKFNKFYRNLKTQNKSGWTKDDYIEEAARLYEEEEGKPFRFSLCVEVLHQVPKFDPMVDQEESGVAIKRVNNARLPQGAAINRPIGSKKAKMVQYLKESGIVISDSTADGNINDNLSLANKSTNSDEITKRLDKNYGQRERQMKLKRIDLYIKLNQLEKANALMKEVEEEEERLNSSMGDNVYAERTEPNESNVRQMPALPPPVNEVIVGDGLVVESQMTGTSI
jgi:hypothetical protein